MLVYGKNVARELLYKKNLINKIYLSKDFNDKELLKKIEREDFILVYKSKTDLDKMAEANSQGIIIDITLQPFIKLDDILKDDESNFIVILDHLEDPHNFGAILRTCECAGVNYIIIPNKRSIEINATVMKTSSGALTNVNICEVANLKNTIDKLKENNYWIVGAEAEGEDYTKIDYSGKTALVIGSEGRGLKQIVKNSCDFIASIPMKGKVNSLNASVASGILIYEILKSK